MSLLPLAHTILQPLFTQGSSKLLTQSAQLIYCSPLIASCLLSIPTSAPMHDRTDHFFCCALLYFRHPSGMILPSMFLLPIFVRKMRDPRVQCHRQGLTFLEKISYGCFSPHSFTARPSSSNLCPAPNLIPGSQLQRTHVYLLYLKQNTMTIRYQVT